MASTVFTLPLTVVLARIILQHVGLIGLSVTTTLWEPYFSRHLRDYILLLVGLIGAAMTTTLCEIKKLGLANSSNIVE